MPKRRAGSATSGRGKQESLKATMSAPEEDLEEHNGKITELKKDSVSQGPRVASSGSSLAAKGKKGKKKTAKKEGQIRPKPNCVIYIGHIPHGFFEDQMKGFFSQFGDVKRARVSRNMKTGGSRGYGFVEFKQAEVAKIAAETMHNYELFERYLQVHVVPKEKLHRRMFEGADKVFKEIPRHAIHKHKMEKQTTESSKKRRMHQLVKKEREKRAKLAALGIEYEFEGFEQQIEPLLDSKNEQQTNNSATTPATSTAGNAGTKRDREDTSAATSDGAAPPTTGAKQVNVKTPARSSKKSRKTTPSSTPSKQGVEATTTTTPGSNNSAVARRTRNRSTKKRKQ
eukprot:gb/GECG01006479.1/.p1 GENE.gb/GECG01006479.1/~~gb/GECG01006479.1/.p1  ORF type:complete len:341 (+),score=62.91 gb/GECG01006479.1/:1-1023(+)